MPWWKGGKQENGIFLGNRMGESIVWVGVTSH